MRLLLHCDVGLHHIAKTDQSPVTMAGRVDLEEPPSFTLG
jgi:hypothetical protein